MLRSMADPLVQSNTKTKTLKIIDYTQSKSRWSFIIFSFLFHCDYDESKKRGTECSRLGHTVSQTVNWAYKLKRMHIINFYADLCSFRWV